MSDLDPVELERSLQRSVRVRIRIYGGVAALWGVLQLALFRAIHPDLGPLLYVLTAMFAACAAVAFARAGRLTWSSTRITGLAVGLGLFQLVIHAVSVQQTHEEIYFYTGALVIVGAGMLLLHTVWSAIYAVAGSTIMLAIGRLPGHAIATDLLLFEATAVISVTIHVVGRHYLRGLETLRQHDRRQTLALATALEETRRQLADRERIEAERAEMDAARRQLEEQLLQAQKMEAVGTLAGGFAHDMNNVLQSVIAGAELLREEVAEPLRQDVDDLITASQRGAELTRNLLGFARRGQYRKEDIDVRGVITGMIRMLQRTVPKGVVFDATFDEPCPAIEGDPGLLMQALINLCLNAVDAMRGVGHLAIAVRSVDLPREGISSQALVPGTYASITVTDTGGGMDAETRRRIFEPFFTTKKLGHGTGLGLAMVYGTVKSWNGVIDVQSTVGSGTSMTLYLPTVAARDPAMPKRNSASHRAGAGTILVVDDDPRIRKVARRILESRGYTVIEACDGAEALTQFDSHRSELQLVVLDMSMPVMGGAECFRNLRERDPEVRVLLASGYALEDDARSCIDAGAVGFIDKPYTLEVFAAAVNRAVRGEPITMPVE